MKSFVILLTFLILLTGCRRADTPLISQGPEPPDALEQSAPLEGEAPVEELAEFLLVPEEVQAAKMHLTKKVEGSKPSIPRPRALPFTVFPRN